MREIKIPYVAQKRTDNLEKYLIQLIDDGKPTLLDQSVNYRAFITYDGSLVTPTGIELTIQDNQLVLDSAKLDFPAGIYRFEIWAEKDGQRAIYPDTGMKRLAINANAIDLPNGTVTSLTLDEFVKEFREATKGIEGQGPNTDISIDVAKRTITINGKSLTIPEPVDLGGLASKDDIAGLVKQTELAEYVKKNDLPDLTGYAKMSDLPSVTDLVNKSELANYAKKSDLPVIPDLTPFLKTADADKKFATKSEIPSLDGYARKTDLSNYATKDDLKTVTSNTTRHAPTAWTLDRTTNPWTIWFDNGCGLQFPDYGTLATIYGYGFSANVFNSGWALYPLIANIMSASHGSLTPDNISKINGGADYWAPSTKVINPIYGDVQDYDWSNVYFNQTSREGKVDYKDRQKVFLRVMYELGIWSIDDIKPFGLTKKEG